MMASIDPSEENSVMRDRIQKAYQQAKAYFAQPAMRSEEVQTKADFFRLADTIPEDESYTYLMASKGAEDCTGFVDMWTSIFHTSKAEAQRVAKIVGLEPLTPEMTGRLEDKILASFAEGAKSKPQR